VEVIEEVTDQRRDAASEAQWVRRGDDRHPGQQCRLGVVFPWNTSGPSPTTESSRASARTRDGSLMNSPYSRTSVIGACAPNAAGRKRKSRPTLY
jgi:hypothetical protein